MLFFNPRVHERLTAAPENARVPVGSRAYANIRDLHGRANKRKAPRAHWS